MTMNTYIFLWVTRKYPQLLLVGAPCKWAIQEKRNNSWQNTLSILIIIVVTSVFLLLIETSHPTFLADGELHCAPRRVYIDISFNVVASSFSSNHVPYSRTEVLRPKGDWNVDLADSILSDFSTFVELRTPYAHIR